MRHSALRRRNRPLRPSPRLLPPRRRKQTIRPIRSPRRANKTKPTSSGTPRWCGRRPKRFTFQWRPRRSFEFINFGIVALALGIPLFRFLPKFLRKRAEKVRTDIETARKATEDANTRLSAVETKLASLDEEIGRFRAEVEAESREDEARIKAALEDESTRIVATAEQEIGAAAAQAKRGLRNFAAELAVEQAAKQMVLTPETDRTLIAEFVGDVRKGGQN